MQCGSCQRNNPDDARFCNGCGASLGKVCGKCERDNDADARFCGGCGSPLDAESRAATPREYTPRHLVDQVLTQRAALEGERKLVTVLFSDVQGSMEIAGQVDPETWHEILDGFFEILTEGVHRFEGTVNQYTGDGIMAIFGAPIAHEDHAQRACWAALYMKDHLRDFGREVMRRHGVGFSTRTGIHSGEVVVGRIGDDLRMDYTAQGHTVGLAARMESLAAANSVYLTGSTASLVEGYLEVDALGDFEVKGVADPVAVFELVGVGEARTRFDVSLSRGLSRFVGRESDMATLESALQTCQQGRGQVVGVVGEAGVGKSRLCFEFVEACRMKGIPVFRGSAVSHGNNLPAYPMIQVFRDYFGLSPTDDPRAVREKLAGRIVLLAPELQNALPLVFDFFGVPDPERPPPSMDPDVAERRTAELLSRLVQSETTTVSLIEDLHWFDPASEVLLGHWVDAIAGARSLLVLNFRPEYRADWMHRSGYQQLGLTPLGRAATLELIADLVGDDAELGNLAEQIADRSEGSPFFTEEIVRDLVERGSLTGSKGAYRLSQAIETIEVPQTVQPLLAARIDRLGDREKRVLQAASVIGKDFEEGLLAAVVGEPAAALREPLAGLKEGEFVYESALFPTVEYSFRHPLTQEVAYASQLVDSRKRLHAAVADSLASVSDTPAALLAYHREAAGQPIEAAEQYCAAAEQARFSNSADAVRWFRRVRELVAGEAGPEIRQLHKRSILGIFVASGWREGMSSDDVAELYAEGVALGEADGDDWFLAALGLGYTPTIGLLSGNLEAYYQQAVEADCRAAASGDPDLQVGGKTLRYYSSIVTGRNDEANEAAEQIIQLAGDDPRIGMDFFRISGAAFGRMARSLGSTLEGDFEFAARDLTEAEVIARGVGGHDDLCHSLSAWGIVAEYTGTWDGAVAKVRSSVSIAESECSPHTLLLTLGVLGRTLCGVEDWSGALEVFERALALTTSTGTAREQQATLLAGSATCFLGLGRLEDARRRIDEALELIRTGGAMGSLDDARLVHAQILAAEGDPKAGDAEIAAALESDPRPGSQLLALLARVKLATAAGWSDVARRTLHEVIELAGAIGADGHHQWADARLAALLSEGGEAP